MDALPDPELINSLSPEQFQHFLEGPAGVAPPGEVSDLDAHGTDTWFVLFLVLWVLASICFLVRISSKAFILRKFVKSDYAMTVAWAFFMAFFVPLWMTGEIAPDVAQWNLRLKDLFRTLFWYHVAIILYGVTLFFIKLSLLFQLVEIFGQGRDWFWWSCHALIGFNFVYYLITTCLWIFPCKPLSDSWNLTGPINRQCLDLLPLLASQGVVTFITDGLLFVMPMTRIWRLQMPLRKKIAFSAVFSIGPVACVCGVMRLYYAVMMFRDWRNLSHYMYITRFWMIPETAGWIVAGCLPSVPKLARTVARSDFVARWRTSFWKALTPASSRATGNGDGNPAADEPEPSPVRSKNWWSRVESIPLTTFTSLPGTTDATRNIHSANSGVTTRDQSN
ncbi:putative integral membrane protein [Aspergillus stella-maris]|uniref:putative integral membrane protein n=1 Tax=Aspergillus stella-maris TaxID=1810926 RepID=UPI003CCC90D8